HLTALVGGHGHERELGLQEEERRFAAVAAHFLLMLGIVAADAENAPHGKGVGAARNRQRRRGPKGDCVSHAVLDKREFYSLPASSRSRISRSLKRCTLPTAWWANAMSFGLPVVPDERRFSEQQFGGVHAVSRAICMRGRRPLRS